MSLFAGTGKKEITPVDSQFLFGYPHVERFSIGVHDPLYSTALCLESGGDRFLIISNDIIFVGKQSVSTVRESLRAHTGIPEEHILISATHTHSGPLTIDFLSNAGDPVVPKADKNYIKFMEQQIIAAGKEASSKMEEVEIGLAVADGTGIGTNRRDPLGPADMDVPVLGIRSVQTRKIKALMLVCSMHPTVLHEDSKLISSDFPGMARAYLERLVGEECAVIYHTGCEGNQSPRHVTKSNTFEEAERLGNLLGSAVEKVLPSIEYRKDMEISSYRSFIDLPGRQFPEKDVSEINLKKAVSKLQRLRQEGSSSREIRTAECDWFGAEETLTLSEAQAEGLTDKVRKTVLPFEIQIIKIGDWSFVAWAGEFFIEYGLAVRQSFKNAFVINLANGELQGYIVTKEAAEEGGYEASNSLFSYKSGELIVAETEKLLKLSAMQSKNDRKSK